MSLARSDLLRRLVVLRDCLAEPAAIDGTPHDLKKNAVAGMIRGGLAVMAFSITEAFIRERTGEVLNCFSSTHVTFNNLSEGLQKAVTISALKGVLFRSKFQDKSNEIAWVLGQIPTIANASTNISRLSPFAFGQSSSNLGDDDPTTILSAFGVSGGWATVSGIAKRIGLGGVLDCAQAFKDLSKRRHAAAHDVTALIPLNDLNDSLNAVLAICCSFDLLLSHALTLHNLRKFPNKTNGLIQQTDIKLRFISPHPTDSGKYREQVEGKAGSGPHTVKVHPSATDATNAAVQNAKGRQEHLIILASNGLPEGWEPI